MQEHALPEDDGDEDVPEPPEGDSAQDPAGLSSQSPDVQSAAAKGGPGLQVQWRWSQDSHPEQGVTCMAWNQVSLER